MTQTKQYALAVIAGGILSLALGWLTGVFDRPVYIPSKADTVQVIMWEGHIDTILKKDRRLWWTYVANKHEGRDSADSYEFLQEAMLADSSGEIWGYEQRDRVHYVDYALCVGIKETGDGAAGIGDATGRKVKLFNRVGIKYSPNYFNWADFKGNQNNAGFRWWGYSYYNLIERRMAGYGDWTDCWAKTKRENFIK